MSPLSKPEELVVDLFAETLSTAVAFFTMPHIPVFFGCEADPEHFRVAKGAVVRQFAKTDLDAGTDVGLRGEAAEAAVRGECLVPEMASARLLGSLPEKLLLEQCTTGGLLPFLESFW